MNKKWRNIKEKWSAADSRMTEFWFGLQAVGTSFLSLVTDEAANSNVLFFLIMNVVCGFPQMFFAWTNSYQLRHWTNWLTSMISFCISVSLIGEDTDNIAIYGYAFLGFATLHCAFVTNRLIHVERNHRNKTNEGTND